MASINNGEPARSSAKVFQLLLSPVLHILPPADFHLCVIPELTCLLSLGRVRDAAAGESRRKEG